MAELSIVIPSRQEMFLSGTIKHLLSSIRGDTEIIAIFDGAEADPPIVPDKRVRIIYNPISIGQRAATNQGVRLSEAKYVMKMDAHCTAQVGFDVKMMDSMQDNWTMVPLMKNLHMFDWKCMQCGKKTYQGPTPGTKNAFSKCVDCGNKTNFRRKMLWHDKVSPSSTSYRFDRTLKFQYFPEFRRRPEGQGDITPTMSLQGSCFMLTRDKYWELNICDEEAGSWGHQGSEVALKTWLSGGEVMCNQTTWYAHMFRTQGGDFSFPYEQSGRGVERSREYIRDLFLNNKWDKAIHDVQWLVDKFAPVPEW